MRPDLADAVAIIGLHGRFPGAASVDALWRVLDEGREVISRFTRAELLEAGVPTALSDHPSYVPAGGVLQDAECFDAAFFGYAPREAALMDPQHRLFLECAWGALEAAGYDPMGAERVGVFGGVGGNTYLFHLARQPEIVESISLLQLGVGTGADFLATRVAHQLNLTGPALTIQTACSTSLVAVHVACQSLLAGECDMALAGAASVLTPQKGGYLYQEGGILSPDGHCKAYSADASGTVFGNAAAMVVLKRYEEALSDGDCIRAVIRGSATNNDGADKVGYTAPSVSGQAAVIKEALAVAGVSPGEIAFVEGHGTGTTLGDAIELRALHQVFLSERKAPCPIGSLKPNVGHLNATAGVAGLIKAVLALEHRRFPKSLYAENPTPTLAETTLFAPTEAVLLEPGRETGICAGVSSFGFGGTNAHIVLEGPQEVDAKPASVNPAPWQILPISARTDEALAATGEALAARLETDPIHLEEAASTLQLGRHSFAHRSYVVAEDRSSAAASLRRIATRCDQPQHDLQVAFVFSGQGTQRPGMGSHLYAREPLFRAEVDGCLEQLDSETRRVLWEHAFRNTDETDQLNATEWAQPALFVLEYALARVLMRLGLTPCGMLGHSIGEWVAATLAGVFSLSDALALVTERGRCMQACPPGAMLAVSLSEAALAPLVERRELNLAAVNGPDLCVVSGTHEAIDALAADLGASCKRLRTSHAFHSHLMEDCLEPFAARVEERPAAAPNIPVLSNLTGTWLTEEQATSPHYWAEQIRQPVRFADGVRQLAERAKVVVEVGPGRSLSSIIQRQTDGLLLVSTLPDGTERPEQEQLLSCLGRLWAEGVEIDFGALHERAHRKVPLPTYPFARERYDLSIQQRPEPRIPSEPAGKNADLSQWLYLPTWHRLPRAKPLAEPRAGRWLVFTDDDGIGSDLIERLRSERQVIEVRPGDRFLRKSAEEYALVPDEPDHYQRLLSEVGPPAGLVHLWTLTAPDGALEPSLRLIQARGFISLLGIEQAHCALHPDQPLDLFVITNGLFATPADDAPLPEKALLHGPCKVIPLEDPTARVKVIDLPHRFDGHEQDCWSELGSLDDQTVALRRNGRWEPRFEREALPTSEGIRGGGTVLITGGLGGMGHALAEHFAQRDHRLVLTGRRALPSQGLQRERFEALRTKAEVLYLKADVTDADEMSRAVASARDRFGKINGVLHCAGLPGGGLVQLRTPEDAAAVLAPKTSGALNLHRLFEGEELDFFYLCSSANSVLGGVGQVAYVAGNAYLDALAHHRADATAISWGTWRAGMAVETPVPRGMEAERERWLKDAILPEEGAEILDRLYQHRVPHAVISPIPLEQTIERPETEREVPATSPADPSLRAVATIWEEVLGVREARPSDSFFELGGHSLLAVQLVMRLRETFQTDLKLESIFEHPTIEGLAALVSSSQPAGPDAIERLAPGPAPLSFAQERLWFLEQLEPGTDTYSEPHARRLHGRLDPERLERAIRAIIHHQESLRTVFRDAPEGPVQVTVERSFALECTNLSDPTAIRRRIAEAAVEPFDLQQGPLFRVHLFRLDEDDHVLFLNAHHIIFDEWSIAVFLRQLTERYAMSGRSGAPLPVQYRDFAAWQVKRAASAASEQWRQQIEFWRGQLASIPHLDLPTDRPRPARQRYSGSTVSFSLDASVSRRIQELSRTEGITTFMVLLACFDVLLARYSGQTDFGVGVPVAGRTHPALERLIGFFVNMITMRADLSGNPTFRELLMRVRSTCVAAYDHQEIPFEHVVQELSPERDLSRHPLFQVAFDLQTDLVGDAELEKSDPPFSVEPFHFRGEKPKFDLVMRLRSKRSADQKSTEGFDGVLVFKDDLFTEATAQRLIRSFLTLVTALVEDPEARIERAQILSDPERKQLLESWNETCSDLPDHVCLHQLFEASAAVHPDRIAVLSERGRATYGEVERRANQIAHLLRGRGVGPHDHVGVWMERSHDLLPVLLGILKAGAAYVPLSPVWPSERVRQILSTTGAVALITEASFLRRVHEISWNLALSLVLCPEIATPAPTPEALDQDRVCELWDHVAERARDRVAEAGFVSSFTGQPFSEREVEHYQQHVLRIAKRGLNSASRVLEIGCGSGLMMFALAPQVERYVGLDPSSVTQEKNRTRTIDSLELLTGFAHEIDELEGSYDLVLMASTAQFFPGPGYLFDVLDRAMRALAPKGRLIVADVPDLRQRSAFREELTRYAATHEGARTKTTLEDELYLSDRDFLDFAAAHDDVAEVEILQRQDAGFDNELSHRFDVILHKGQRAPKTAAPDRVTLTGFHLQEHPTTPPPNTATLDHLAYVIFTSGSTGEPKGVAISHRSVGYLIDWVNRTFSVSPADRVLSVSSLCFDLSVYDLFGLVAAGGSVYVASDRELSDAQRLAQVILQEGITFWNSAPAVLQQLTPFLPNDRADRSVRLFFLSGDWVPLTLPDRVRGAFPDAEIIALGGATEGTIWDNAFAVEAVEPHWSSIPYGRPIRNVQYYVLDAYLEPCPVGVPGDLYMGGRLLADRYTNDPRLTADRFIPDPFGKEPGGRLYRFGDRGRYLADGNIEFLGRADQQVKIRGFRIELGEVETALRAHPGLTDVATAVLGDRFEQRLVACCVEAEGFSTSDGDLRRFLWERLPDYMIPSVFLRADQIPLTSNGKVDRGALAEIEARARRELGQEQTPRGLLEQRIAAIWREVLQLPSVGREDNFFDIGGNSLLVVEVFSRLQTKEVGLVDLFTFPTIRSLAERLAQTPRAEEPEDERANKVAKGKDRLKKLRRMNR